MISGMASQKSTATKKKSTAKKSNTGKNTTTRKKTSTRSKTKKQEQSLVSNDVKIIAGLTIAVILTLSNFSLCGTLGDWISFVLFGLFGVMAYVTPICVFVGIIFFVANISSEKAMKKLVAAVVFFIMLCVFMQLIYSGTTQGLRSENYFMICAKEKTGGGIIGGGIAALFSMTVGIYGAYIITIAAMIISVVVMTERSLVKFIKDGSTRAYDNARDDFEKMKENSSKRLEQREQEKERRAREREERAQTQDNEAKQKTKQKLKQKDRQNQEEGQRISLSGIMAEERKTQGGDMHELHENSSFYSGHVELNQERAQKQETAIHKSVEQTLGQNVSEIMQKAPLQQAEEAQQEVHSATMQQNKVQKVPQMQANTIQASQASSTSASELPPPWEREDNGAKDGEFKPKERIQVSKEAMDVMHRKAFSGVNVSSGANTSDPPLQRKEVQAISNDRPAPDVSQGITTPPVQEAPPEKSKEYVMPPLSLLKKGMTQRTQNRERMSGLSATARKLQETLNAFGVKANVVDESRGPSVTRYELQPETGTKVSKITSLADDIKLNLAASDIRIEAPIPGKAAVGIEVPNDTRDSVFLRDLIESNELKNHPSKIAFAAGMDIAGNVIVADIAKMPHMLIAGTTGSGKSVFTNSIIMSILYRAKPDEVKLIIVDPKVVEFGIYNGIPHLMTPVVTDPRKAAGALNWAVAEMQKRYQLFAKYGVRDLKGYNEKIQKMGYQDGDEVLVKKEQIVIIIDELADLMMVAAKDVEGAICRLAQLARAAGIHLIIATQRPSVDVVTGLIKANIPSRVALLVSSGTDSRTIIDCNGGEKLLGNGDMLFYPSGYVKPVRLQGAFVSDGEVSSVVEFLISHNMDVVYDEEIGNATIQTAETGEGQSQETGGDNNGRDALFAEAGRFVIEKEKGSTSMLQRMFKIGFNRAARIIDQLEQAGVVGQEEGTKPRKVLMTLEEFEQYLID